MAVCQICGEKMTGEKSEYPTHFDCYLSYFYPEGLKHDK